VLLNIFLGIAVLIGLGLAFHDHDGHILGGLALAFSVFLIMEYAKNRRRLQLGDENFGLNAFLRARVKTVALIVAMFVISIWALVAKVTAPPL